MYSALPFLLTYLFLSGRLWVTDLRTGFLPDRLTCPLLWSGLIYHQLLLPARLPAALWGAVAGYVLFALLYWSYRLAYRQEGLGYGDVKFLAALGAWHEWQSLPMLVFIAAFLACAAVGMDYFRYGKAVLKNPLPFGPYMAAAGFIMGWKTLMPES